MIIKRHIPIQIVALVAGLFAGGMATAATDTATQTMSLGVQEVAVVTASGNPGDLLLAGAADGTYAPVVENTTTLSYASTVATTNVRKITAAMTTGAAPAGTKLVLVASPAAGQGTASTGVTFVNALDTGDLITGIGSVNASGVGLEYTLSVTDYSALTVATGAVEITFTLTAGGAA